MKFENTATDTFFDTTAVLGKAHTRIDGPLKVSGQAPYAYERHDVVGGQLVGYPLGATIARGRIVSIDAEAARAAPGVTAIVTTLEIDPLGISSFNDVRLFGGDAIQHYHQAIAVVVADTLEHARHAANMIKVTYEEESGLFDMEEAWKGRDTSGDPDSETGNVEAGFADASVTLDATYRTPVQSHAMMEPHASVVDWSDGERMTVWTSNQMIAWNRKSLAQTFDIDPEKIRVESPYVGGGFGAKLFLRSDAVLAAIGARAAGRPVKLALPRPFVFNNTTHRPATIQRIRLAAERDGRLTSIEHEGASHRTPHGSSEENPVSQTEVFYAAANRRVKHHELKLHLPESSSMRAPGEASGLMALEIAMDEMADKLGMDPVEFRILNDTQVDPQNPDIPFSDRHFVDCLRVGSETFGWSARNRSPGSTRDGMWLIGHGVAGAYRGAPTLKSGARVRLKKGRLIVETDMTDIGTGSYTIIAQTAAEMMGLTADTVDVRLGNSDFPVSSGSGGQFGAASSTAGVYAACLALRNKIAEELGSDDLRFEDGRVIAGNKAFPLADLFDGKEVCAEDSMDFGDSQKKFKIATFAAHFVEVGVHAATGTVRVRRMLAVCDAGRILNPVTARSQVIGGMTMALGAALSEELLVDTSRGYFVNHDLAGYEVPVHADVPQQDVIFLDTEDPEISPLKAKGVGELGICGVAAAIANAVHNATGIRIRDYPVTLDKLIGELPEI